MYQPHYEYYRSLIRHLVTDGSSLTDAEVVSLRETYPRLEKLVLRGRQPGHRLEIFYPDPDAPPQQLVWVTYDGGVEAPLPSELRLVAGCTILRRVDCRSCWPPRPSVGMGMVDTESGRRHWQQTMKIVRDDPDVHYITIQHIHFDHADITNAIRTRRNAGYAMPLSLFIEYNSSNTAQMIDSDRLCVLLQLLGDICENLDIYDHRGHYRIKDMDTHHIASCIVSSNTSLGQIRLPLLVGAWTPTSAPCPDCVDLGQASSLVWGAVTLTRIVLDLHFLYATSIPCFDLARAIAIMATSDFTLELSVNGRYDVKLSKDIGSSIRSMLQ